MPQQICYEQLDATTWRLTAPPESPSRVIPRILAMLLLMGYFAIVIGRALRWLKTGSPIYACILLGLTLLGEFALLRIVLIELRRMLSSERLTLDAIGILIERPALLFTNRRRMPRKQITDVSVIDDSLHIHRRGGGGAYIFTGLPEIELRQAANFLRIQLSPAGRTVLQDVALNLGRNLARRLK